MIELIIGIVIATMVMGLMYSFLSGTRLNFMFGTVSLANLQEARLVISYLRRDFAAACPFIADYRFPPQTDPEDFATKEKVRSMIFDVVPGSSPPRSRYLQVSDRNLLFYRFKFDPNSKNLEPVVEPVRYEFLPANRTLRRTIGNDPAHEFKGLDDVRFSFYVHDVATQVPVLFVNILVHETYDGKRDVGQPLEISTSITSQFLNNSTRFLHFNQRSFHRP